MWGGHFCPPQLELMLRLALICLADAALPAKAGPSTSLGMTGLGKLP